MSVGNFKYSEYFRKYEHFRQCLKERKFAKVEASDK
jgi:hypothetical protein